MPALSATSPRRPAETSAPQRLFLEELIRSRPRGPALPLSKSRCTTPDRRSHQGLLLFASQILAPWYETKQRRNGAATLALPVSHDSYRTPAQGCGLLRYGSPARQNLLKRRQP